MNSDVKRGALFFLTLGTLYYPTAAWGVARLGLNTDSVNDVIAIIVAVLTIFLGSITVTAYVVRLTNSINSLKSNLIDEIRKNHDEIINLKSESTINAINSERRTELLQKDVVINYKEIYNLCQDFSKRITNLERFEAGKHGYRIRNENDHDVNQ